MNPLLSRISTLFIPIRMVIALGNGGVFSPERRAILSISYRVLARIGRGVRTPEHISLWFRGNKFTLLLESSADFALIREVFLDEEYKHQESEAITCIFDVGANVGAASIYFHCLYPHATIYAFEPDPLLFEKLSSQVSGIKEIVPLQIALSDRDGEVSFYRHAGSPLAGSLLPRSEGAVPVVVKSRTLTSITAELGIATIDLLKFDIEGAEQLMFASPADRSLVTRLIGEAHLDLLAMSKEEFANLFSDFTFAYVRKTAEDRYIVWAQKKHGT